MTHKLVQNQEIPVFIPFNDRRFQDDTDDFDFVDDLTLTLTYILWGASVIKNAFRALK